MPSIIDSGCAGVATECAEILCNADSIIEVPELTSFYLPAWWLLQMQHSQIPYSLPQEESLERSQAFSFPSSTPSP